MTSLLQSRKQRSVFVAALCLIALLPLGPMLLHAYIALAHAALRALASHIPDWYRPQTF